MARRTPEEQAEYLAQRIAQEVKRAAGLGLQAGIRFLASRTKETLSVPAPRRRVTARNGDIYYVAKTPAIKGAPPRKLSGRLRGSVTSEMRGPLVGVVGSNARASLTREQAMLAGFGFVVRGFNYPAALEADDHKWLMPTYEKYQNDIAVIVGKPVKTVLEG